MQAYFKQIRNYEVLSQEREKELCRSLVKTMAGLLPFVKTNALLESFYLSDLSSIPNLTDPLDNRNHIWPHPREPHE